MKNHLLILIFFITTACISCNNTADYRPTASLSEAQLDSFKYEIIRYAGRLVKNATHQNKFEFRFDDEYKRMSDKMTLDHYYVNKRDGYTYFQIRRIAPSLHERYVATGGRLKRNSHGSIEEYEEIYRTWKMEKEELAKKTAVFFDYIVKGKELSPFYTANIGDTEHIEFPDHQTFFNKETRQWEMITPDSLQID